MSSFSTRSSALPTACPPSCFFLACIAGRFPPTPMTHAHLPMGMTGAVSWLGCSREAGGLKLGDQAAVIPPRLGPHSARLQGEARGLLLRDQEPLS